MRVAFEVLIVAESVLTLVIVLGLFIWAAVKDGQANDAARARIVRRHWPRHTA
jgi:hypothetical protein